MTENQDEAWKADEGVPLFADAFIQKYLSGRDALVEQEKKQRSDRLFRANLSPTALEACSIVDAIRFEESQTLWTREFEDSLAEQPSSGNGKTQPGPAFPGMMFMLAKERMERSKLWKIVRRMPKGALLHCHFEAMVDIRWTLNELMETPGMHFKSSLPLHKTENRQKALLEFQFSKQEDQKGAGKTIWAESYQPDTLVPLVEIADAFPDGGRAGFLDWMYTRLTISIDESTQHHEGVNEIWDRFISCFPTLGSMTSYEPIYRRYLQKMFSGLNADGIRWVDWRAVFMIPYRAEGDDSPQKGFVLKFKHLEEEIEKFKASEEGKGFWGARMIWTSSRGWDAPLIVEHMKECIELKQQFPDLIGGYDLVGQEDLGRPLSSHVTELFWFKKRCVEAGVDIPFFFHAGECLGDGDETDENLFDAVALGTRRIGHAFSLYKHPLLIDMVKDKRILVESCPISNEVLRLTGSILSHPLPALLARGVPAALCNDDPSVFGIEGSGSTHDFWQALQGWENLGLAGLGSLAENSVRWANFEDCTQAEWQQEIKDGVFGKGVRAERIKEWMKEWERFCAWIVEEFGEDENLEPEE